MVSKSSTQFRSPTLSSWSSTGWGPRHLEREKGTGAKGAEEGELVKDQSFEQLRNQRRVDCANKHLLRCATSALKTCARRKTKQLYSSPAPFGPAILHSSESWISSSSGHCSEGQLSPGPMLQLESVDRSLGIDGTLQRAPEWATTSCERPKWQRPTVTGPSDALREAGAKAKSSPAQFRCWRQVPTL